MEPRGEGITENSSSSPSRRTSSNSENSFAHGAKPTNSARLEDLRTEAFQLMATSAKRHCEALEERNAIAFFPLPELRDDPETKAFFSVLASSSYAKLRKRLESGSKNWVEDSRMAGEDVVTPLNDSNDTRVACFCSNVSLECM